MQIAEPNEARRKVREQLIRSAFPRRPLTHLEFAERFVRHATGQYRGQRFRGERQPILPLLFHEFDFGGWPEIYLTGTSQSGKTLGGFVIPTLRTAVALEEDALVAVPEADMAADKWDKDFLPTLNASSELSWLVPTRGPGSRGGHIRDRVTLNNGVDIKIMTRGGEDTNKAGYTARVVHVTEAKGWGGRTETSSEADDLRKIIARMRGFKRSQRRLVVEGTLGSPLDLPWTARGGDKPDDPLISTKSKIQAPCPHCGVYVCPGRESLVGWQGAATELEAAEKACFVCPSCGTKINDAQRRAAMRECRLVHHGQTVDKNGRVIGDRPPVSRLWFQWGAFHNCLLDAADTAIDEWRASLVDEGTLERENSERELCQFAHGLTFTSMLAANTELDARSIRRRMDQWPRGVLPPDTVACTIGIDMGRWTGWWVFLAFRACGEIYVAAYGQFDVCRPGANDDEATRFRESLGLFDETVVNEGFAVAGSPNRRRPDGIFVDMNYLPDEVAAFVRSRGRGWKSRWKCGRGAGMAANRNGRKNAGGYHHPTLLTPQRPKAGMQWFVEWNYERGIPEITFNADFWLRHLQDRLRIAPGNKGALSLYRSDFRNEHAKISNHFANERLVREFDPAKGGLVEKWHCMGDNHWGDAAKMALVLGDWFGFRLSDIDPPPAPPPAPDPVPPKRSFWADLKGAA